MNMTEPGFDASTFSKNRLRLVEANIAKQFFGRVVAQAQRAHLMSQPSAEGSGSRSAGWGPSGCQFSPPTPLTSEGGYRSVLKPF